MMQCVAVFGPTASGKSSLALRLAKVFNGVIISCDSMQIYRGMNIGTAKPDIEEQKSVPHKMIDICSPNDTFSVWDYKKMAEDEIEKAISQNKLPIVVGGTGLYLDSLFFNTSFGDFEIAPHVRKVLNERIQQGEGAVLLEELKKIDPECAEKLHEKDAKRIVRALEVFYSTGKTLTAFKAESHKTPSRFSFLKFHLKYEKRETLYQRINVRVDDMIRLGLLNEIRALNRDGLLQNGTAAQAIGYKEFFPYLNGTATLDECVETLKQKTRNYAKRQITWFNRYDDAISLYMDRGENVVKTAVEIIKKNIEDLEK